MVNPVYDHIIAIIVVSAVFIGTVVILPTLSLVNLRAVDQQQLRNTAYNVFDAILLGAGRPSDWGSTYPFDQSEVKAFGLAYSHDCSLYVLDTDKVQRMDVDSPGYIEYEYVKELLNLEGYGFNLRIFRPFTVECGLDITGDNVWFAVKVINNDDGEPVPNAEVTATMVYSIKTGTNVTVDTTEPMIFFTNALGMCESNQTVQIPQGSELSRAVAVLKVTVAGMSTITVAEEDDSMHIIRINTFGDNMTISYRNESVPTSGARWILNILSYDGENFMEIYEGGRTNENKMTWGYGYYQWYKTFPGIRSINPPLLIFTLSVPLPDGGRQPVIVVGPFSPWDSNQIFGFGPDTGQYRDSAVKLRRFVVISGMTYIAELTLWKE